MKQFFKFMFASIVGFFISLIILFFLVLGLITSMLAFAENEVIEVKEVGNFLKKDLLVS